jgi:hypothetical protein
MFYYLGRIELYQEHYEEAGQYLAAAFRDCLASANDHKRKILRYLVPVSAANALQAAQQCSVGVVDPRVVARQRAWRRVRMQPQWVACY